MSDRGDDAADPLGRRLHRLRARARAALLFERLWPALWPAAGVGGLFVALALFGLLALLPAAAHDAALAGFAVAFAIALWRGLRGWQPPDPALLDRRIERASGLAHRPLAFLADRPAGSDEPAAVLWRAQRDRVLAGLGRLRAGWPHPGLAARDRRALRGGLVVLLVAAGGVAGVRAPARLAAALRPELPASVPALPSRVAAWITPPAYTGLAPLLLDRGHPDVSVPAGSALAVSVSGGTGAPRLRFGRRVVAFREIAPGSFRAGMQLAAGGRLALTRDGAALGHWNLSVIADAPPVAAFTGPLATTPSGAVRLPWRVADDYGVVSLAARMRLVVRPSAAALGVAIPLPGTSPRAARGVAVADLTARRFAGLRVAVQLVARDAPGQVGRSA
ncbi:MAG: DUF4175 family protein, partial [Acetobacteraceae bacterium]